MIDHFNVHSAPPAVLRRLAGLAMCCLGAAEYGPHRCTCWRPVFEDDQAAAEQAEPDTTVLTTIRESPCHDCAFRPGSPERSGDPDHAHNEPGDLDQLVTDGNVFWCHQGMRAPTAWIHPSGVLVSVPPSGYQPIIRVDDDTGHPVPYKLDGTPADVCAGWAARRLHHIAADVIFESETP